MPYFLWSRKYLSPLWISVYVFLTGFLVWICRGVGNHTFIPLIFFQWSMFWLFFGGFLILPCLSFGFFLLTQKGKHCILLLFLSLLYTSLILDWAPSLQAVIITLYDFMSHNLWFLYQLIFITFYCQQPHNICRVPETVWVSSWLFRTILHHLCEMEKEIDLYLCCLIYTFWHC